jgi:hypothetical protein
MNREQKRFRYCHLLNVIDLKSISMKLNVPEQCEIDSTYLGSSVGIKVDKGRELLKGKLIILIYSSSELGEHF